MTDGSKQYYNPDGNTLPWQRLATVGVVVLLVLAAFVAGTSLGGAPLSGADNSNSDGAVDYGELYNETKDGTVGIKTVSAEGESGSGSGFIYDSNGHIVTNAHVVAGAETIYVQYSDGSWVEAEVVGADPDSDLAVVRAEKIPDSAEALEMETQNPQRGERVMILGSPLELENSVSHGIVTGVGRELRRSNGFVIPDIVQTDASVNPGNSGSPVVTRDGDVTGVVTARQGDNIGYAISAEMVNEIVPELIENGSVNHSYVGIQTIENDPVIANANNHSVTSGMAVVDVVEGSPADGVLQAPDGESTVTSENGVRVSEVGDVIVGVDGNQVRSGEDLSAYLMKHTEPGDTVTLTVVRDGERKEVELTLSERPE